MRTLLFFSIFTLLSLVANAQHPYKQQLGNLALIEFPDSTSVQEDTLGQRIYSCSTLNAIFMVTVTPYPKGVTPLKSDIDLYEFYNGFIKETIKPPTDSLVARETFTLENLKGRDIEYFSHDSPTLPAHRFIRTIVVNDLIISCYYWQYDTADKVASAKERAAFFGSLAITADKSSLYQYKKASDDTINYYKLGKFIGKGLAPLVLLLVIAGITFGIIYLSKRTKKKSQSL